MEGLLEDRRASLQATLDALNDRVARLEAKFEDDRASTMRDIEARNRELTAKLEEFQVRGEGLGCLNVFVFFVRVVVCVEVCVVVCGSVWCGVGCREKQAGRVWLCLASLAGCF